MRRNKAERSRLNKEKIQKLIRRNGVERSQLNKAKT